MPYYRHKKTGELEKFSPQHFERAGLEEEYEYVAASLREAQQFAPSPKPKSTRKKSRILRGKK